MKNRLREAIHLKQLELEDLEAQEQRNQSSHLKELIEIFRLEIEDLETQLYNLNKW